MNRTFLEEYLTEDNFSHLLECAAHYAGLLGKTIEIPCGALHERINRLYHRFAALLPNGQEININSDNGRLLWIIYRHHNWSDYTFYWMPVKFITLLSGQIREIAMSFMHLFIRRNGLERFRDGYEFDFFFEWAEENLQFSDFNDSEKQVNRKLLDSYFDGEISHFLDAVYDHKPVDVISALDEYVPACPIEEKLFDCFRKGLPFISKDDCIMSYGYDPYTECFPEEYDDTPPVTIDRIIRYVYDTGDYVTNELEAMTNQCFQETYALEPVSYMTLCPDSILFVPGDYPERFSEWFLEMMDVAKEITASHE